MGITKNQLSNILSPNFDPIKSNVRLLLEKLNASFAEIITDKNKEDCVAEQMSIYQLLGEKDVNLEEYLLY